MDLGSATGKMVSAPLKKKTYQEIEKLTTEHLWCSDLSDDDKELAYFLLTELLSHNDIHIRQKILAILMKIV